MNYETQLYRVYEQFGAPLIPNDTSTISPHNPVNLQNLCRKWIYFWINSQLGNFRVYVTLIRIKVSPIVPYNTIRICTKNSGRGIILALYLKTNYEIR